MVPICLLPDSVFMAGVSFSQSGHGSVHSLISPASPWHLPEVQNPDDPQHRGSFPSMMATGAWESKTLLKKSLRQNAPYLWVLSLHSCLVILPSYLFGVSIFPTEVKKERLASSWHSLFWPHQHYNGVRSCPRTGASELKTEVKRLKGVEKEVTALYLVLKFGRFTFP